MQTLIRYIQDDPVVHGDDPGLAERNPGRGGAEFRPTPSFVEQLLGGPRAGPAPQQSKRRDGWPLRARTGLHPEPPPGARASGQLQTSEDASSLTRRCAISTCAWHGVHNGGVTRAWAMSEIRTKPVAKTTEFGGVAAGNMKASARAAARAPQRRTADARRELAKQSVANTDCHLGPKAISHGLRGPHCPLRPHCLPYYVALAPTARSVGHVQTYTHTCDSAYEHNEAHASVCALWPPEDGA